MAMVIKNNAAAQAALGELKKNNDKLSGDLKKVASGMKINGARDDASGYAISERMRVRYAASNRTMPTRRTRRASSRRPTVPSARPSIS